MLELTISSGEKWNEATEEFVALSEPVVLKLEHSLVSLSKWESNWKKSFLSTKELAHEELKDYIRCMTLNDVPSDTYEFLRASDIKKISEYISATMTATTFSDTNQGPKNRQIITAEIIYYWMIALNIPFECQYWHLDRLLTLIRVCQIKNEPQKKMSMRSRMSRNSALNAARRKQLGTKG